MCSVSVVTASRWWEVMDSQPIGETTYISVDPSRRYPTLNLSQWKASLKRYLIPRLYGRRRPAKCPTAKKQKRKSGAQFQSPAAAMGVTTLLRSSSSECPTDAVIIVLVNFYYLFTDFKKERLVTLLLISRFH